MVFVPQNVVKIFAFLESRRNTVMRGLLTGHALWYNRRHRRHGHLFQNRYKSILCQEDAYPLELALKG